MPAAAAPPLLEMRGIVKTFPGVRALDGVSLTLHSGEVLALMGENGAGKSTLMKVLSGVYPPDAGEILISGQVTAIHNPTDARHAGISIIYQELDLIPQLSVRENLFLGREQTSAIGFLKKDTETEAARQLFDKLGVQLDPDARIEDLSVAQQQFVEIAKALAVGAKIVVMDEPSAALSQREVESLFDIIAELKSSGIGIVYISHRMEEVDRLADRVTVIRDGQHIGDLQKGEIERERIIQMMVGRSLDAEFPKRKAEIGSVAFCVKNLTRGTAVRGVSFDLHHGEVLGLTGLVGAGRTELARLLFGADRPESGSMAIDGRPVIIRSPRDAIRKGICLLTEDRKHQGLVLIRSVRENFGLPNLRRFGRGLFLDQKSERASVTRFIDELSIRVPHTETAARNLSGGNQQKVVLAKWLERDTDIIIFDEPTRGIDVGAKVEIYEIINRLAARGKAILMISSELPEILGMSDRILVMREGEISGEITDVAAANQAQILQLAMQPATTAASA